MILWQHQPTLLTRHITLRNVFKEYRRCTGFIPEQSNSRIATPQRAARFYLVFGKGLHRIPSRRPEEWNQRSRWYAFKPFHGKRERRIIILGWLGLTYIAIGQDGGTATVTMRGSR